MYMYIHIHYVYSDKLAIYVVHTYSIVIIVYGTRMCSNNFAVIV